MKEISKLLKNAGFDPFASKIVDREVDLPFSWIHVPENTYNFLPAMIPLWHEDSQTVGYWVHWLIPERKPILGIMTPEDEYRFTPMASDFFQLLVKYLFKAIVLNEGVPEKTHELIQNLGISKSDVDRMVELSEDGDFDLNILPLLDCTKERPRRHETIFQDFKDSFVCSVELEEEEINESYKLGLFWLKSDDPEGDFQKLVEQGEFVKAWLLLNSNGWLFSSAKNALKKLIKEYDDPLFHQAGNLWINCGHDRYGGGY